MPRKHRLSMSPLARQILRLVRKRGFYEHNVGTNVAHLWKRGESAPSLRKLEQLSPMLRIRLAYIDEVSGKVVPLEPLEPEDDRTQTTL